MVKPRSATKRITRERASKSLYQVETVLGKRWLYKEQGTEQEFYIKWKNYDDQFNSWEPGSNLTPDLVRLANEKFAGDLVGFPLKDCIQKLPRKQPKRGGTMPPAAEVLVADDRTHDSDDTMSYDGGDCCLMDTVVNGRVDGQQLVDDKSSARADHYRYVRQSQQSWLQFEEGEEVDSDNDEEWLELINEVQLALVRCPTAHSFEQFIRSLESLEIKEEEEEDKKPVDLNPPTPHPLHTPLSIKATDKTAAIAADDKMSPPDHDDWGWGGADEVVAPPHPEVIMLDDDEDFNEPMPSTPPKVPLPIVKTENETPRLRQRQTRSNRRNVLGELFNEPDVTPAAGPSTVVPCVPVKSENDNVQINGKKRTGTQVIPVESDEEDDWASLTPSAKRMAGGDGVTPSVRSGPKTESWMRGPKASSVTPAMAGLAVSARPVRAAVKAKSLKKTQQFDAIANGRKGPVDVKPKVRAMPPKLSFVTPMPSFKIPKKNGPAPASGGGPASVGPKKLEPQVIKKGAKRHYT